MAFAHIGSTTDVNFFTDEKHISRNFLKNQAWPWGTPHGLESWMTHRQGVSDLFGTNVFSVSDGGSSYVQAYFSVVASGHSTVRDKDR